MGPYEERLALSIFRKPGDPSKMPKGKKSTYYLSKGFRTRKWKGNEHEQNFNGRRTLANRGIDLVRIRLQCTAKIGYTQLLSERFKILQ